MKNKYIKHFLPLLIILLIVGVIFGYLVISDKNTEKVLHTRKNTSQGTERVFDGANKLSSGQEDELRALIAQREVEVGCDIILVTINDPSIDTDEKMMNFADDFYDQGNYGFNKVHGDGCIYVDNWANGFVWFSTCGKVESRYSSAMIRSLINKVCDVVNDNQPKAYKIYVNQVAKDMGVTVGIEIPFWVPILAAIIITAIYVGICIANNKGRKTTTATTYVQGGHPNFPDRRDVFLTKRVTSRRLSSSSGSGGGGGGHHFSSGGISHGGGGGRH